MTHKQETGFAVLEGIFILVIAGLLGFTGWYVWHSEQSVIQTNKQAVDVSQPPSYDKKYTDTANLYTLIYPAKWQFTYDSPQGGEGSFPTIDWSKVSRGFSLLPSDIPKSNTAGRSVEVSSGTAAGALAVINGNKSDKFHTITQLKVNGYDAYLDHRVFVGPSAAEKYTDDYYTIIKGDKAVTLFFRESYYHNTVTPIVSWNDTSDLSAFKDIVYSVRYL
jgi:hypothetical protein